MAKKKKQDNPGGIQQAKVKTVLTREEAAEEKVKQKEKAKKEKKEKKDRRSLIRVMRETGGELKKVHWPSFATTLKQTGVVLSVVVIFSVVVFGIDQGLSYLYKLLTKGL